MTQLHSGAAKRSPEPMNISNLEQSGLFDARSGDLGVYGFRALAALALE
jgi:hypothetical protein